MDSVLLQRFERLTAARTGLHVRAKDRHVFQRVLTTRMQELKLSTPQAYYQLLESDTDAGHLEWRQLMLRLTNRESYFFRDKGQISLLQKRILPELIERNKWHRSLRIWSAGCSTGEEPYTLAILLEQLLPLRDGWNIFILGTDINADSLETARRAVYNSWSFRMVDPQIRARYFHEHGNTWKLDGRIRDAVTFRCLNLFGDDFPSASQATYNQDIHNMDLIICRNVFIYFERDAVAAVLPKFSNTLRDGGYLMPGHAELNNHNLGYLHPRMFPESVIYQRVNDDGRNTQTPVAAWVAASVAAKAASQETTVRIGVPTSKTVPIKPATSKAQPAKLKSPQLKSPQPDKSISGSLSESLASESQAEVERLFRRGAYGTVVQKIEVLLANEPRNHAALYLAAQAHANLGQHDEAAEYCRQAIALDSFAIEPYKLLAHIAEEQGEVDQAKEHLKKIIYLAPSFVPAYVELAALYKREGDKARARKMSTAALEQLKTMPPDAMVHSYGDLTAREMIQHMEQSLRD